MGGSGVLGIGIDLVENERMRAMLEKWTSTFKNRVFLKEEQKYCESKAVPHRHYAARFAVKEAVSKAFGTGMGPHLSWLDMEVTRDDETGAPSVKLNGKGADMAEKLGAGEIMVSLSHTDNYAIAQAVILGDG